MKGEKHSNVAKNTHLLYGIVKNHNYLMHFRNFRLISSHVPNKSSSFIKYDEAFVDLLWKTIATTGTFMICLLIAFISKDLINVLVVIKSPLQVC